MSTYRFTAQIANDLSTVTVRASNEMDALKQAQAVADAKDMPREVTTLVLVAVEN